MARDYNYYKNVDILDTNIPLKERWIAAGVVNLGTAIEESVRKGYANPTAYESGYDWYITRDLLPNNCNPYYNYGPLNVQDARAWDALNRAEGPWDLVVRPMLANMPGFPYEVEPESPDYDNFYINFRSKDWHDKAGKGGNQL